MTKEKTIKLPCYGIILTLVWDDYTCRVDEKNVPGAAITSDLKEGCPECGDATCYSVGSPVPNHDKLLWVDVDNRKKFNAAMDGIESMILGHAVAGVDVENSDYIEGIETAVQACGNHFS